MGVIKRQTIKQSIVTYLAIAIGTISYLFIYTKFLTEDEIGFIRFFQDTTFLLLPIILFGSHQLAVKYFPYWKTENRQHNGFLSLLIIIPFLGFVVFCILFLLFYSSIESYYQDRPAFADYAPFLKLLPILVFFTTFNQLFAYYCVNFKRITVPAILNNLFIKAAVPSLVLIYAFYHIPFEQVIYGLVATYGIVLIAFIFYIRHLGQWSIRKPVASLRKSLGKEMRSFALFSVFGGLGSILATRIDVFMVTSILGLSLGGVFTIAVTIGTAIEVPKKALSSMTIPFISEAWRNNDMAKILELYQKTSLNQFIVGSILLACVWASIDSLYEIIPNGEIYSAGKYVVLFIGLSKVVDMVTGANNEIIQYSPYFRFNFYAILCLAVLNIFTNIIFIKAFYINGAALATLTSLLIYNAIKFIYIYKKMKIHPLSWSTLWALLIILAVYGLSIIIPGTGMPLVDIIIRSVIILGLGGVSILYFRVSPDLNDLFEEAMAKIKRN